MKETKFKQTEVGLIPSDWEVKTVGKLLKIGHGKDYKNLKSGNVPVYGTGGYMTSVDKYLYDGETVCIGRKGTIDKPFYHIGKIWTVDTLFYTFGFNGCIPKFIYYAFGLVDWLGMNEASGVPSLTSKNIEDVLLRIPPTIEEQQRIANALSDVDTLIANLEKLIAKKKNIKQGAMQQLLTGRKRLPGFGSDERMGSRPTDERRKECHSERSAKREVEESSGYKMTELGMIPTDWKSINLGSIADIRTGKRNGDESEAFGKYPFFVRSQTVYRINSYSFDGEAILIPGEGGIGSIFHYINGKFDYHQRVYKISDFSENFCAKYLFYFMKRYFGPYAMTLTVKATVDSLRLPTFENFVVWYPPSKEEQPAIANVLSDIDTEIATLETKLAKYRKLKTGMMQQLLTGKIRLV